MKKIIVIGEILVEIMADRPGQGFLEPLALTGPFPSGAPAIFVDQAARLGQPAAIISAVGDDDFGRLNIERLRADGVDVEGIQIDPDRPTGSAFVRYRHDGTRDFVFNIRHSACGQLQLTQHMQALLDSADHLHVMGSALTSPNFAAPNREFAQALKTRGGTISFDPNLRKEIIHAPGVRDAMLEMLALCDLYLPSDDELCLLTDSTEDDQAFAELLQRGISAVVHKLGKRGARYVDRENDLRLPAFSVKELDPTGAGDCFGATFTSLWLQGAAPADALRLASAAGARAVTQRGPMEGNATLQQLQDFIQQQETVR